MSKQLNCPDKKKQTYKIHIEVISEDTQKQYTAFDAQGVSEELAQRVKDFNDTLFSILS